MFVADFVLPGRGRFLKFNEGNLDTSNIIVKARGCHFPLCSHVRGGRCQFHFRNLENGLIRAHHEQGDTMGRQKQRGRRRQRLR